MNRIVTLSLCLLLTASLSLAADMEKDGGKVKALSGMSIVGNDEAPKALYIVPWKSSEIGAESSLNRMDDAGNIPIDRDVFIRQLNFYEASTAHKTGRN